MYVKRTSYKLSNCEMVSMKGICMSAYFLLVCVRIVSMLLDVLALYVGDLQVEVFPITVSSKPGGGRRRTWEASVKVRRYRCIAIDSKA